MTSSAVVSDRLDAFPVAIETGGVARRHGLESARGRREAVRPTTDGRRGESRVGFVADGAVVVLRRLLLRGMSRGNKERGHETRARRRVRPETPATAACDNILMLIVWKLCDELTCARRMTEGETRFVAR